MPVRNQLPRNVMLARLRSMIRGMLTDDIMSESAADSHLAKQYAAEDIFKSSYIETEGDVGVAFDILESQRVLQCNRPGRKWLISWPMDSRDVTIYGNPFRLLNTRQQKPPSMPVGYDAMHSGFEGDDASLDRSADVESAKQRTWPMFEAFEAACKTRGLNCNLSTWARLPHDKNRDIYRDIGWHPRNINPPPASGGTLAAGRGMLYTLVDHELHDLQADGDSEINLGRSHVDNPVGSQYEDYYKLTLNATGIIEADVILSADEAASAVEHYACPWATRILITDLFDFSDRPEPVGTGALDRQLIALVRQTYDACKMWIDTMACNVQLLRGHWGNVTSVNCRRPVPLTADAVKHAGISNADLPAGVTYNCKWDRLVVITWRIHMDTGYAEVHVVMSRECIVFERPAFENGISMHGFTLNDPGSVKNGVWVP